MSFRASALGFLLALFTSLAALAQQSVQDVQQDNVHKASNQHGDHPHAGIAEDSSALPLEELQMFADVFNQIRQGYVESVPDSKLFELAVRSTRCRKLQRESSADWVSRSVKTGATSQSSLRSTAHPRRPQALRPGMSF